MKKQLNQIIDNNWFFVSLICFVIVLPFSTAMVSIISGVILVVALTEDSWNNKIERARQNKILIFIPAIYMVYLISTIFSGPLTESLYDLKKNLFFLVLPIAFIFGKSLLPVQKRYLFYTFSFAVAISTIVALANWLMLESGANFSVHNTSLISHIRFSFQLILAFWFMILLIQNNYLTINIRKFILYGLAAFYFVGFLLFQQSLTGLIAFITSSVFYMIYLIFKTTINKRIILFTLLIIIVSTPVAYISWVAVNFYDIEEVDRQTIDRRTVQGNLYWHDFDNPMVENGKYVYLYVCHEEARNEWNKISDIKYDSIGGGGYPIYSALMRYMTSKGLRKDAEGVRMLTPEDVENVQNGIANVIFAEKKFSLYPRVYQTIWEYYIYTRTGYANHQSFSQRVEFAHAALTIIKNNFWLGIGTANWKEEFAKAYVINNSKLDPQLYASSHNQYLNYMVKFGIIGFLFILFALVYPAIKTRRYKDLLFSLFLVFMFFVNFADSNFESHMGGSFFVFFYCVFLITDGIDYLQTERMLKKP